jgi:tRNA(fMet)-specific endonuclease VapC
MRYLLDTCLISELVAKRPNVQVVNWVDGQPPESLYLSVITLGEIAKGICKLAPSNRKSTLQVWLHSTLPKRFAGRVVAIDTQTMLIWGDLVGGLEKQGRSLPVIDSLIAAIALQHTLTLVTRNEDDFAGTNIVIFNPWLSSA